MANLGAYNVRITLKIAMENIKAAALAGRPGEKQEAFGARADEFSGRFVFKKNRVNIKLIPIRKKETLENA